MCVYEQEINREEMLSNNLPSQALCTLDDLGVQGKYSYCRKLFKLKMEYHWLGKTYTLQWKTLPVSKHMDY